MSDNPNVDQKREGSPEQSNSKAASAPDIGIFDIPDYEYHAGRGISKSALNHMGVSPAHYKLEKDSEHVETAAMAFGSLFHTCSLERERLDSILATAPDCERRSKADKQEWVEFWNDSENMIRVDVNGAVVYKDKSGKIKTDKALTVELAITLGEKIMEHPIAKKALENGMTEKSLYAIDDETGILKRCRLDMIPDYGNALIDLKTTVDASPKKFIRTIGDYNYHVQGSYYMDIANQLGLNREVFIFIAIEKEPPYGVAVYQLDEDFMQIGRNKYRLWLNMLSDCIDKDEWPSYGDEIIEAKPLPWQF